MAFILIMICSLPFRPHVANFRQHVAVHSQGFVGAASFVVSDCALAAFCFEAAQTSGPAPDTMSHEALRPKFGMTICSDGTALRGSEEDGFPSPMLQLLAGNVMAMLQKKDEETAAEERSCQEAKQESFAENGATADSSKGTSSQQCHLDPPLSETKSKKRRSNKKKNESSKK